MKQGKQQGRLYLVGVGPGDPELMTCKAVRVLEQTKVWVVPKARENGASSALQIVLAMVGSVDKEVLEVRFPMKKIRLEQDHDPEVQQGWQDAARIVLARLDQGEDVAFPTLGDPGLYSTSFYLLNTLQEMLLESCRELPVTIIPGITAMAACSAQLHAPLGLGDDVLSVVPAAFDDTRLRDILLTADTVVLMKVFRRLPAVIELLDELGLTDKAVVLERCGMDSQRIYTDIREAAGKDLHYFSTLLIRKKQINKAVS
ncbi:precorrin-2 C20-methyltransferase; cobalt-factor II C20-methyltransferase [Candidatus Electrothrix aarhusensis]|jgi:precorrin-2/cobalt-factor-2 C20-methyltransferase|uniref:Precorrin-2 C20-methyltransferase n=1 Tax=Candidatus Electrothrix aarhusensis TaxID=1859131 RepID=A0A3S3UC13_9BACT|nr:precorrin-2 C20-methyltransferase; cobalt-factor II C20-methyltransferase [Candidatus Electrothrix aarhusensis]